MWRGMDVHSCHQWFRRSDGRRYRKFRRRGGKQSHLTRWIFGSTFYDIIFLAKNPFAECAKLQFCKKRLQRRPVRFLYFQLTLLEFYGYIEQDRRQFFGDQSLFGKVFYIFPLFSFQLMAMFDQCFYRTILLNEFLSRFFAYAWDARNVIYRVSPKAQDVDHLRYVCYFPFFQNFRNTQNFSTIAHSGRFINKDVLRDQL